MENKMREEFEAWAKDNCVPLLEKVGYAYFMPDETRTVWEAWQAAYQAGRNHPIEVSLEEARAKYYNAHIDYRDFPVAEHFGDYVIKALLSVVPNCVVKE